MKASRTGKRRKSVAQNLHERAEAETVRLERRKRTAGDTREGRFCGVNHRPVGTWFYYVLLRAVKLGNVLQIAIFFVVIEAVTDKKVIR